MATVVIVVLDVLLTFLLTNLVGPGAIKPAGLACQFASHDLPGQLFRAPFYLLRFYIGIAALLLRQQRKWFLWGPSVGLALTIPLAFMSTLPDCPKIEPWANMIAGLVQGAIIGWVAVRLHRF